jgi:mannose-1-phosphate guanylyltransferase
MTPSHDTRVMLLAAGRGTRLGPLGVALPKPMVPVCGYPAIRFGLAACARAGLGDVTINLFHHGGLIRAALGDGADLGVRIRYSEEADLLGTGGGIAHARPLLGPGPVLVINAKVVAAVDLGDVLRHHGAAGAVATMVLRDDPAARRWGAIRVDETGRVVGILDARSPILPAGAVVERMFTGIHVVEPALMDRLRPIPSDVIRDAYIPALEAGARIAAVRFDGYFAEHSTPARYLAGNLALLRAPALLPYPPGPLTGVDPNARVAAGAVIHGPCRIAAGATIAAGAEVGPAVVIGAGAHVAAGVRLREAVVWPDTVVTADADRCVVTPTGIVPVPDDPPAPPAPVPG